MVTELAELIAIPSVSADPVHADDIRRAADWVVERIRAAGGEAEIQERGGRPLVIGRVAASTGAAAPTVRKCQNRVVHSLTHPVILRTLILNIYVIILPPNLLPRWMTLILTSVILSTGSMLM